MRIQRNNLKIEFSHKRVITNLKMHCIKERRLSYIFSGTYIVKLMSNYSVSHPVLIETEYLFYFLLMFTYLMEYV